MKTIATIIFLAMPFTAVASTIYFTQLPGEQADGFYVGYSQGTVNGVDTNLLCDDFGNVTNFPSGPWTYSEETLSSLSGALFTQSPMVMNYKIAAILLYEYNAAGGSSLDAFETGSYQFALWSLFTPSAGSYGDSASILTAARNLESTGGSFTSTAYSELEIFTPVGQAIGNQEFLALDPPTATPEPNGYLYMAGGFLTLYAFMILRRTPHHEQRDE